MTTLDDRRRALEEEYFRKRDAELIDRLRKQSDSLAGREAMSRETGITDPALLQELEDRGFSAATVSLLPLVPLLEVAWAENVMSAQERELIVEAARAHGVSEGTQADRQLTAWLDQRPPDEMFQSALRIIRSMFASLPTGQREQRHKNLRDFCLNVASASGGVLGFGRISAKEEEVLKRVAAALEASHGDAARTVSEG
jgi:hypothetical protein